MGLHDVMIEYLNDNTKAPNTYQRGRNPLDTILCNKRGVVVKTAGYLTFREKGWGPSSFVYRCHYLVYIRSELAPG